MSSHHFVTDKQSSALYITGRNIDENLLCQLLEWNPLVIAGGSTVDWLQECRIHIDCLVMPDGEEAPQFPYEVEVVAESRILDVMKDIFAEGKAGRLVIAGPESSMVRPVFQAWSELDYPVSVFAGASRFIPVTKGDRLRKWVGSGYRFDVDPMNAAVIGGEWEKKEGMMCINADGWLVVDALDDVIFQEFY